MVASPVVRRARPTRRIGVGKCVIGLVMMAFLLVALTGQAFRGNAVVNIQRSPVTIKDAELDDAFYRCINVQAHSLVSSGEPVFLIAGFGNWVTLIKAVGSWMTIAPSRSDAKFIVSVRSHVTDRPACLGTAVVAIPAHARNATAVEFGTGASVPGVGPPPAPPL